VFIAVSAAVRFPLPGIRAMAIHEQRLPIWSCRQDLVTGLDGRYPAGALPAIQAMQLASPTLRRNCVAAPAVVRYPVNLRRFRNGWVVFRGHRGMRGRVVLVAVLSIAEGFEPPRDALLTLPHRDAKRSRREMTSGLSGPESM
jgi:hypothetical protein